MNTATDTILEQLSALMDGELGEAEARFLLRRIQADPQLQAKWSRMQVASSCMKGQPWAPARSGLCVAVGQATEGGSTNPVSRPVLMRWGVAASLLALAVLFGPRLMHPAPVDASSVAATASVPPADHLVASPGSADLVAARAASSQLVAGSTPVDPGAAGIVSPAGASVPLLAGNAPASTVESPLPLSAQSPTDFPLVESADKRSWPRSGLAQANDDPALEAYLVRHNQMLANDGLGGFVPYLDVVATDPSASATAQPEGDAVGGDGDARQ